MLSTCAKCGNRTFEIVENSPNNARYKLWFVQCSKCGNPVSTKEYYDVNTQIQKLEKKTGEINSSLDYVLQKVNNIETLLRQMS